MRDGKSTRVRLWGIDAPEDRQAFGARAKQFVSEMCFDKEVRVIIKDIDHYKRTVGMVLLEDGRNLNHEIVRAGMAWWYAHYPSKDIALRNFEEQARKEKRGLWRDAAPTPPWMFRKGGTAVSGGSKPSGLFSQPPKADAMVYVTRTGTRYHRGSCSLLKDSAVPISVEEARKRGLTPCAICSP